MDEAERIDRLENDLANGRVITSAYSSLVRSLLAYIVHRDGEVGRTFVEGLKHRPTPVSDPQGEAGRARPDYARLFETTMDEAVDAALASRWIPNPPE